MNLSATGTSAEAFLSPSLLRSQQLVSFLLGLGFWFPLQGDPAIPRRHLRQDVGGPGRHRQALGERGGKRKAQGALTRVLCSVTHSTL